MARRKKEANCVSDHMCIFVLSFPSEDNLRLSQIYGQNAGPGRRPLTHMFRFVVSLRCGAKSLAGDHILFLFLVLFACFLSRCGANMPV